MTLDEQVNEYQSAARTIEYLEHRLGVLADELDPMPGDSITCPVCGQECTVVEFDDEYLEPDEVSADFVRRYALTGWDCGR